MCADDGTTLGAVSNRPLPYSVRGPLGKALARRPGSAAAIGRVGLGAASAKSAPGPRVAPAARVTRLGPPGPGAGGRAARRRSAAVGTVAGGAGRSRGASVRPYGGALRPDGSARATVGAERR